MRRGYAPVDRPVRRSESLRNIVANAGTGAFDRYLDQLLVQRASTSAARESQNLYHL